MSKVKIYSYQYIDKLSNNERKRLLKTLNHFEQEKVKSFKRELDADISLLSRFLLRHLLAPMINRQASAIEFLYNDYNRPYLKGIDFNLSHSGNRIIIAINPTGRIGVDIEKIRKVEPSLAEICFTEEEKKYIFKSDDLNLNSFFQLWTLKEAFIKADGKGMSYPLLDFYFKLDEKIEINFKNNINKSDWIFNTFEIDPDYKMSLCLEGGIMPEGVKIIKDYNEIRND